MSLIPDELKTQYFPCPNCGRTISDAAASCPDCSAEISQEFRELAVGKALTEKKNARVRSNRNYMLVGGGLFLAGVYLILMPILQSYRGDSTVNISCLIPLILVGGIVVFLKGLRGYRNEQDD